MDLHTLLDAPQLGEFVWHQLTNDPTVEAMSLAHLATLRTLVKESGSLSRPPRVLELGAYRHFSGHLLADESGAEVWMSDISADALRAGRALAQARGLRRLGEICAADFHDLPFADGYFDVVFIASAVHHTRRPECVLREMARVVRPGGLIWLENEPVGREACFYKFNSNRPESYTALEQRLADLDLIRLLSSPFPGTRPEEMFCMVENDRIPLDLYLTEFAAAGDTEWLRLETGTTIQAPEKRLLQVLRGDADETTDAVARLLFELLGAAKVDDPVASALGFALPTEAEIRTLARRIALALVARHKESSNAARRADARCFGAALQARIRRNQSAVIDGRCFRRQPLKERDCWLDTTGPSGAAFLGMLPQFPDVHDPAAEAQVRECFDPAHWGIVREAFGANSLYNLGSTARLPALTIAPGAVMLLRLYTVPHPDGPYVLRVRQGHRVVAEGLVAQAESRLLRGLVYADGGEIWVEHADLDGKPFEIAHNLRIGVAQYIAAGKAPGQ